MNTNHYTYEELEALLPDYAFGRLDASSAAQFEQDIKSFPELQSEVEQVQKLFSKMQTMKYHEDIDYRTRNLSVLVNESLQRESTRPSAMTWLRRLAPVMVLSSIVMFFYYRSVHQSMEDQSFDEQLARMLSRDSSAVLLAQSGVDANVLPLSLLPHDINTVTLMPGQDSDQIEGLLAESIVGATDTDGDLLLPDEQSNEALDLLNTVDIQDVEQQIKEVENGEG